MSSGSMLPQLLGMASWGIPSHIKDREDPPDPDLKEKTCLNPECGITFKPENRQQKNNIFCSGDCKRRYDQLKKENKL